MNGWVFVIALGLAALGWIIDAIIDRRNTNL